MTPFPSENGVEGDDEREEDEEEEEEEEDEEEEEEEEEDEPRLKYQRMGGSIPSLLSSDAASCIAVAERMIALGTHDGTVHILDFLGNQVKEFPAHTAPVNDLSFDTEGEFVGSCSDDGSVVINSLFTDEKMKFEYHRPMKAIALDPDYTRKTSRRFVAGGLAGHLYLNSKKWLGYRDQVLHSGEGPIHAVKWRTSLIAWANDAGVKVYDTANDQRITFIERPRGSPRPELLLPHLVWQDDTLLVIGWGTSVKIASIKTNQHKGTNGTYKPTPLSSTNRVDIVASFQASYFISGLAPFGDALVVLAYIPGEEDGEKEFSSTVPSRQGNAQRPEVRIVSWNNDELSTDALPVHGFEHYKAKDYYLARAPFSGSSYAGGQWAAGDEPLYYIVSPKDVVIAKPRDAEDHIAWLLQHGWHEKALAAVEAGQGRSELLDEVGSRYLDHLIVERKYAEAASLCPKLLRGSSSAWERWGFHFAHLRQLPVLVPYMPTENPRLRDTAYEVALVALANNPSFHKELLSTVKSWPPVIYSVLPVISAIEPQLNTSSMTDALKEALAELYVIDGQFEKAFSLYADLMKPDIFDFIEKHDLHDAIREKDALDSGNCNRIRLLMRFLVVMMCSKVLQPSSLVVVFEALLSSSATTVDEEKGNPSWQACADFYIACILSCLPWGGAELIEQVPEEIDRVMVGVEAYMSIRRHVSDDGLSFFEDDVETQKGSGEKDFLEDLWDRIKVLSNNGWKVDSVPRPHLSFEAQLVAGKSHDFGPISCPDQPSPPPSISGISYSKQRHDAELKYPQRVRRLDIFPASKIEDLQPIDRFLVEEYLLDVLFFLNGSRKECASYMVGLPVPFRYEYLMAETIFSQLLLLPQPPFKPIYYTLVIIDLCKALPGAFPAVVAGAVRALFEKIADLDMECRTRLILWFSHHLSNFQFIWPWEEWAYVLDLPKWAPQRVFVQEVLEREVRLSYWDKIKQSIESASALEELLPPKGGPNFKYVMEDGTERTEEHALSAELNSMVKGRQTAREMISWIEERVVPSHGLEVTLTVVVQTLLDIGSKSFTHLITVLERYGQVIAKICPDEDKQVMLIAEVSLYWENNTQMTAIAIDRMMGYRLISNLAIVRWVFSPENIEQFHTSDRPWEILRNAVSKTYNRITDLRKEISSLKKAVILAEEAAAKANAEVEIAESKLSLIDGEPVLGENPVRLKRLKSHAEKAKEVEVSARDSLEAKEALLARALNENEALFRSLYKNFSIVLMERLPYASTTGAFWQHKFVRADEMAIDVEEPSAAAMEVDTENGRHKKSQPNGSRASSVYSMGEKEQWCLSTLGYVKSFSRQYASEIWPHIEKLDAEVFTEDVHPLFRKAVYSGLHMRSS